MASLSRCFAARCAAATAASNSGAVGAAPSCGCILFKSSFEASGGFGVYRQLLAGKQPLWMALSPTATTAAAATRPLHTRAAAAAPSGSDRFAAAAERQQQQQQQQQHQRLQQQEQEYQERNELCLSGDAAGAAAVACYTNKELLCSLFVYSLCTSEVLVRNCERLLSLSCRVLGPRWTFLALKNTFFRVFCGGEDLQQVVQTLQKLQQRKLGAILDYAAEQKVIDLGPSAQGAAPTEAGDAYEETLRITKEAIDLAASRGGGFVATKVTAFGETEPMVRFNALILRADRLFAHLAGIEEVAANGRPCPERLAAAVVSRDRFVSSLTRHGVEPQEAERLFADLMQQPGGGDSTSNDSSTKGVSYFQWAHRVTPDTAGHEGPLRCLSKVLPVLSRDDLSAYQEINRRFLSVCAYTAQQQAPPVLLVDAEQSSLQAYIHHLTVEAQKRYNKDGGVLVSNTYQAYLKDTLSRLKRDLELARRFGFTLSLKLVRGAYVRMEEKIAEESGEPLQVHDCIEDTHQSYDACVQLLFDHMGEVEMFLASHNVRSLEKAAGLLRQAEREMGPAVSRKVAFGQLYGMGDTISHGLAAAGFSVFKYLPFGPVEETVPYLIRRAQENGGMLGGAKNEVRYLLKEVKRRLVGRKQV